jgi:uncharacterized protein (DUF2164 family)
VAAIAFSAEQKQRIVERIRYYFADELKQEIGRFDAEFLLDFFVDEIGAEFYNRGLLDAQAVLAARIDDVQDAISQLERTSRIGR